MTTESGFYPGGHGGQCLLNQAVLNQGAKQQGGVSPQQRRRGKGW